MLLRWSLTAEEHRMWTRCGGPVQEIQEKIEKYGRTVKELYPIIKDQEMDVNVKKIIHNNLLIKTLIHELEIWSVSAREEKRIAVAEMKVLRAMLGKTLCDRVRNE